ncbi:MAG TPA: SDR family oxidoreductase [Myxococcota bacterium]|nr:SDR family oxidoreductase [Myxococcota bacterium]
MGGVLDGKIAIVTGTSRGVGIGIARALLEAGATVVGCSRRELPALPAAEGLPGAAARSAQWVCDQGDFRQIDAFVARVAREFGRVDILVNNAGGTVPTPHAEDVPALVAKIQGAPKADDDFERTALYHAFAVQMNLVSPLWFALRVARQMLTQDTGTGSIVNISSGASHSAGAPTLVSYGAAKSGMNHMTKSLAQEWGPRIRVNCLALGPTTTENFRRIVLGKDDPDGAEYFKNLPLRRAGEPEEVGRTVVFLCSGAADVINGATLLMDGGMLPGVLYEPGIAPIRQMLAAAGQKGRNA